MDLWFRSPRRMGLRWRLLWSNLYELWRQIRYAGFGPGLRRRRSARLEASSCGFGVAQAEKDWSGATRPRRTLASHSAWRCHCGISFVPVLQYENITSSRLSRNGRDGTNYSHALVALASVHLHIQEKWRGFKTCHNFLANLDSTSSGAGRHAPRCSGINLQPTKVHLNCPLFIFSPARALENVSTFFRKCCNIFHRKC
jgi:hypothetical protein